MKLFKYFLIFNGVYYVLHIAIGIVGELVGIDISFGASAGAIIAGGIVAGRSFVRDHQRLPSRGEKRQLVIGSFALSLALSCVLTAILIAIVPEVGDVFVELATTLGVLGLIAIFAVVVLFYIAVMYFSFGFLLTRVMKDYAQAPRT